MKITKSNTKKDEHSTKQIKYRRKFNFTAPVRRRVDDVSGTW